MISFNNKLRTLKQHWYEEREGGREGGREVKTELREKSPHYFINIFT